MQTGVRHAKTLKGFNWRVPVARRPHKPAPTPPLYRISLDLRLPRTLRVCLRFFVVVFVFVVTRQPLRCLSSIVSRQVLHCCVSGSNLHTQQSHYLLSLSDLSTDYEPFLVLGQVKSSEPPHAHNNTADFGSLLTVAEGKRPARPPNHPCTD